MAIKTFQNTAAIASGAGWFIDLEGDGNLRQAIRDNKTQGIQIKNASKVPIKVKIDGSDLAVLVIAKKAGESVITDYVSGILITNEGIADEIAIGEIAVTVTTGANAVSGATGLGDIFVTTDFKGSVNEVQVTSADAAAAVVASETKLVDVLIICSTHPVYLGDAANQRFPLAVGETLGITRIDLNTLYIKNQGAGNNGVITILGVDA